MFLVHLAVIHLFVYSLMQLLKIQFRQNALHQIKYLVLVLSLDKHHRHHLIPKIRRDLLSSKGSALSKGPLLSLPRHLLQRSAWPCNPCPNLVHWLAP